MTTTFDKKQLLEAAILIAGEPITVDQLLQLFPEDDQITGNEINRLLEELSESYADRGIELIRVASGYRFQAKPALAPWLQRLSQGKVPRYSRAFLETLALIAYRQPITRGDIEEIRGVSVNSNIIRQLMDRDWIKIVGHKEVPGKPALFGTTKQLLDYFSLKALSDLPPLQEIADLENMGKELGQQLTLGIDDDLFAQEPNQLMESVV